MNVKYCIGLFLALGLAANEAAERELIQDNHFRRGFVLWKTQPGKHVQYGTLKGVVHEAQPIWGLCQWSSKFPLNPATAIHERSFLVCSNAAKSIAHTGEADIVMAVNSAVEYGATARKPADPWVHLLVEQEFKNPAQVVQLSSAKLHVEARLSRSRNLHQGDYSPAAHAAQFQIFFTVQNRNRRSPGFGDLLWFGVPIYDNRDEFPKPFKARDFGGTAKFIFTPDGKAFTSRSVHDGAWVAIDKDLLPLIREALDTAWKRGFLKGSSALSDYSVAGMNMGWELPGTFDVEMEIRGLSLRLVENGNHQPGLD